MDYKEKLMLMEISQRLSRAGRGLYYVKNGDLAGKELEKASSDINKYLKKQEEIYKEEMERRKKRVETANFIVTCICCSFITLFVCLSIFKNDLFSILVFCVPAVWVIVMCLIN